MVAISLAATACNATLTAAAAVAVLGVIKVGVLILAGTFLPATVIVIGVPLITMFLESMREVNVT